MDGLSNFSFCFFFTPPARPFLSAARATIKGGERSTGDARAGTRSHCSKWTFSAPPAAARSAPIKPCSSSAEALGPPWEGEDGDIGRGRRKGEACRHAATSSCTLFFSREREAAPRAAEGEEKYECSSRVWSGGRARSGTREKP